MLEKEEASDEERGKKEDEDRARALQAIEGAFSWMEGSHWRAPSRAPQGQPEGKRR